MPFGIGIGAVVALVREMRAVESSEPYISLSGPRARELAAALAEGGEAAAVVVEGDPLGAAVAVRILEEDPSPPETALLRSLARAGTPVVALKAGGGTVPYVLPGDVLDFGPEVPVAALAAAIARAAPDAAPRLAARLPVLREPVARRLIALTSWSNAALAASDRTTGPQLPLLCLAQSRMLLLLGVSRGDTLPGDPRGVALAAGPPVAVSVSVGFGSRTLVRRLPRRGRVVRATVAYAGTYALGLARLRVP